MRDLGRHGGLRVWAVRVFSSWSCPSTSASSAMSPSAFGIERCPRPLGAARSRSCQLASCLGGISLPSNAVEKSVGKNASKCSGRHHGARVSRGPVCTYPRAYAQDTCSYPLYTCGDRLSPLASRVHHQSRAVVRLSRRRRRHRQLSPPRSQDRRTTEAVHCLQPGVGPKSGCMPREPS